MAVVDRLTTGLQSRYRIERELGAGGMAVVYLARDLRHDRQVALKLLRPELSAILGAERFLAEIRTTANLQHPHILPLHDSGEVDGLVYYVMPFVEGESLRDRLRRERMLSVEDAVRIAREVAGALDYAHRRGVVHRDIKPENILLHDGQALVADFGIALAAARSDGDTRLTETGMSLGTPQYMAPEQAMGERDIGPRVDIYALGCVLYEMLVGEPPYAGPTPQAIVARMLTEQPRKLTVQRQTVPAHVEAATLKALQRLPADRFATATQFSEALGAAGTTIAAPAVDVTSRPSGRRIVVPVVASALVGAALASAVWLALRPVAPPPPVVRFSIELDSTVAVRAVTRANIAISPDGQQLVFATPRQLVRRPLSGTAVLGIAGTEAPGGDVSNPVFSPDGQWVAFWMSGSIRRVPLAGGVPVTIAQSVQALGMDWAERGIVFANDNDILLVSPEGGRPPEVIVDLPVGHSPLGPQLLPDGRHVMFTVAEGSSPDRWERARVFVQNIETRERTLVMDAAADGRYVPTGHLLFARGGNLLAVRFNLRTLKVDGSPQVVIEGVRRGLVGTTGTAHYAISRNGTLLYTPGPSSFSFMSNVDIALTSPNGTVEHLDLPTASYEYPRVSPDGRQLVVGTDNGNERVVWVYNLDRSSALRRLTLGTHERYPIWSGDGRWIVYQSVREGAPGIYRKRADGSGEEERLTTAEPGVVHIPESWSLTDDVMLYSVTRNDTTSLWTYHAATRTSEPFGDVRSVGNQTGAVFSPDGKWVAYATSQFGIASENFVFIQPYPATGTRYQVSQSSENGHHPQWSRDQKALFYVPLVGQFVKRSITTNPVTFGNPEKLTRTFPVAAPVTPRTFDIMPDGRVLGIVAGSAAPGEATAAGVLSPVATEVVLVLNWFEELKAKLNDK